MQRSSPLLLALVLCAAPATAEPAVARFVYTSGAGAERCPDAEAIRSAVAARLGHDPFDDRADAVVMAEVEQVDDHLRARVRLADRVGGVRGERDFVSQQSDCAELTSAMALAISIAVDPVHAALTPPPPPTAPVASVETREAITFSATLGGLGALGASVGANAGATLGLRATSGHTSLAVEGRLDLPAASSVGGGTISSNLLAASLLPCYGSAFSLCGIFMAGVLQSRGKNLVDARDASTRTFAAGARAQFEWPLGDTIAARLHADLVAPLSRTRLLVGSTEVWISPALSVAAGAAVVLRFE